MNEDDQDYKRDFYPNELQGSIYFDSTQESLGEFLGELSEIKLFIDKIWVIYSQLRELT